MNDALIAREELNRTCYLSINKIEQQAFVKCQKKARRTASFCKDAATIFSLKFQLSRQKP